MAYDACFYLKEVESDLYFCELMMVFGVVQRSC